MSYRVQPEDLLAEHGQTYAAQAGIRLRNKPAPLFQLLVLTQLSSTRISAEIAATAAHELFDQGWRTPSSLLDSTWQQRVDALGRGGYRRYDESTAHYLVELATQVGDEARGDLRRIREQDSVADLESALQTFPRIGPTGAAIFCREVQAVWSEVSPYFDPRALRAAGELGYPREPARLADLAPDGRVADLAAALVRWSTKG